MNEFLRTITFQGGYNTTIVLLGATILGIASGCVGTFIVLRRRALITDALAHATLPGICLAFLALAAMGRDRSLAALLVGAACTGALGVVLVHAITTRTRLREDAAIGIVLSVFFGIGVTLLGVIQSRPDAHQAGLKSFIYGQAATMLRGDVILIAVAALVVLVVTGMFRREFSLLAFDAQFAKTQGWPTGLLDLGLLALMTLVAVIGLYVVGIILIVAMLIVPPVAARFWTTRSSTMLVVSSVVGGLAGFVGAAISASRPDLPAGSVIVLTAGAFFVVSIVASPTQGVVAASVRLLSLRYRIAVEHVLRALYEHVEHREDDAWITRANLRAERRWNPAVTSILVRLLKVQGRLEIRGDEVRLTRSGFERAADVTRRHRLWEEYLLHFAHEATHVHDAADAVEHYLSPDAVAELERILQREGRLPDGGSPA